MVIRNDRSLCDEDRTTADIDNSAAIRNSRNPKSFKSVVVVMSALLSKSKRQGCACTLGLARERVGLGRCGFVAGRVAKWRRPYWSAPDAALPDLKKTHQGREGSALPDPFWKFENVRRDNARGIVTGLPRPERGLGRYA